jgi:RHS repeat-associated protein
MGFTTVGAPLSTNPLVPVVIYAGQECDLTTKLNYDEARFYDPGMARFINPDPLGMLADTNEYRYCDNSWPNATDPTGCFINVGLAAGGAGVGAIIGGAGYALNSWLTGTAFNSTDFWIATGAGAVAGGVAGLTMGASLLVTGTGVAGGSAGLLGFTSAGAATFVAGATSGMAGAAAAGTFTQGMQILAGERTSFDWTALSTETAVGGITSGLGQLAARSVFAPLGQNLSRGLQGTFGASQQTACAISSTIVSGASGAVFGGGAGAIAGGLQGYGTGGWQGAMAGAWAGLKSGALQGGIMGAAQGLVDPFICFTAGTLVHSAAGKRAIEALRVGQRTLTEGTKDAWDLPGDDRTHIDPATWRLVRLRTAKPAGSDNIVDAELLRPLAWIAACRAVAGSQIHFELAELGIDGPADVLAIEPCPDIEPGRGQVITGTFTTARCSVLEVRLSNGEVLEPTPPHRFFSETRQDWVAAGELRVGECLRTSSGLAVTVESLALKAGEHRVYNLEVEQEHQFYVGEGGVLVHNSYGRRGSPATRADVDVQRDKIQAQHPDWVHKNGGTDQVTGVPLPEMYVPGKGGGRLGSTYPDLTFEKPDGTYHHHNTVDTYADGITMTNRESNNLTRLQQLRSADTTTWSAKP